VNSPTAQAQVIVDELRTHRINNLRRRIARPEFVDQQDVRPVRWQVAAIDVDDPVGDVGVPGCPALLRLRGKPVAGRGGEGGDGLLLHALFDLRDGLLGRPVGGTADRTTRR
jgi:hypothetical protein